MELIHTGEIFVVIPYESGISRSRCSWNPKDKQCDGRHREGGEIVEYASNGRKGGD